ncbi:MAG: hypothetical protein IT428_07105 [Planctomycetaceae bacterium]|nr:hypothetical protein [Planctomycetaceae bacterium]
MEGPRVPEAVSALPRPEWWSPLVTTDLRSIGLFRITLALILLGQGWGRWEVFADLCSNAGPVSGEFLSRIREIPRWPSLLTWLETTRWGVPLFAASTVAVHILLLIGWQSRTMAALSLFAFSAVAHRNPLLLIGADEVLASMLLWAPLLPLGARFSVDARIAAARGRADTCQAGMCDVSLRRPERDDSTWASIAVLGVFAQIAFVYLATAWLKSGPSWWAEGTAVARVLKMETFRRPGAALFEMLPAGCLHVASRGVLLLEYALPLMILSPWGQPWGRRAAIASIVALHGGISLALDAGLFSATMMALTPLLLSPDDWRWLERAFAKVLRRHAKIDSFQPAFASPRSEFNLREKFATWFLAGLVLMNWNYTFGPQGWKFHVPPLEWPWQFAAASQRWHMFGPDAPHLDIQLNVVLLDSEDNPLPFSAWSSLENPALASHAPAGRRSFVWKAFMLRAAQLTQPDRRSEGDELRLRICRFFADDALRRGVVVPATVRSAEVWTTSVPTDRGTRGAEPEVKLLARYQIPREMPPAREAELSENQEPAETASTR